MFDQGNILAPIRLRFINNDRSDEEVTGEPDAEQGAEDVGIATQIKDFMAQQIAFNTQLLQAIKENPREDTNQRKRNRKLPKTLTVILN